MHYTSKKKKTHKDSKWQETKPFQSYFAPCNNRDKGCVHF